MGCDIHMKIERKVDGAWQDVPWSETWRHTYYKKWWEPGTLLMPQAFADRNYDLFAVLAGVRNGTWGDDLPVICEPKGWPEDSPTNPDAGDDDNDDFWGGDHSFSWLTVAELRAYPWGSPYRRRAWVSHEAAAQFRKTNIPPESYAAGGSHGEYIEWMTTVREAVREWHVLILPMLESLGEPDDVRICFGFDN